MKDLKNIIKDLWYQKYNKIKMFNDYMFHILFKNKQKEMV